MFQFTETTVVNTMIDTSGLAKYAASTDKTTFIARRVGNFKVANIVNGIVYKNIYQAGQNEVATIVIPTATAGLVLRLFVDLRLSQQTESDYASTYLYFSKPITAEVISSGVSSTDAAALAAVLASYKTEYGVQDIVATVNGSTITLTATTDNQRFFNVQVLLENTSVAYPNSLVQPEFTDITGSGFAITTHGLKGFGDDQYMMQAIMLPTYENARPFGTNMLERPIPGGNYTQYTFQYSIPKDYDNGIDAGYRSITTQVFYVSSTNISAFETILATNLGLALVSPYPTTGSFILTAEPNPFAVGTTSQITAVGSLGIVTFSSATTATATINANTGIATAVAAGTTVITGTEYIDGVATGASATITLTVVA